MISLIYGTRPELIKLFPLVRAIREKGIPGMVINTGQHGAVLENLEAELQVKPDIRLDVLSHRLQNADLLARLISDISKVISDTKPDVLVTQGDTFTVLASGIAAFLNKVPLAHVEAGLRSFNLDRPFPEEFNRRVTSIVSHHHFVPTILAKQNLLREHVPEERIALVGNTIVDAVHAICRERGISPRREKLVYITTHRRENWGMPIRTIAGAVKELCKKYPDYKFIWSLHPNPAVQEDIFSSIVEVPENLELLHSIGYIRNLEIIAHAAVIMSDSGGIQEEAASLDKHIIILRDVTERPEVVEAGFGYLCGSDKALIITTFEKLLLQENDGTRVNPFGDGKSSERILDILCGK
jgi:UDP-N-acetylglucosamine 2-epimerase (non-hydrolysing)